MVDLGNHEDHQLDIDFKVNIANYPADIVVLGGCNKNNISYASRLPKPGETIQGTKFFTCCGGKGANQSVMSSRLGAKTAMVAKVADDAFGHETIKNFKDNGVKTEYVTVCRDTSTGVALIVVNDQGQNSIVVVCGANKLLTPTEAECALCNLSSAKVLICQLELKLETTLAALRSAKNKGIFTILNPAPATADLDTEFYQLSDIFCPNETEAEMLSGMSVTNVEEAKVAAWTFLDRGCSKVIITMGAAGCLLVTSEDRDTPVHISTKRVTPVDTTGAGDAFVGSLAYYIAYHPHLTLQEMTKRACHIATISVCTKGTQNSFPRKIDLPEDLFK